MVTRWLLIAMAITALAVAGSVFAGMMHVPADPLPRELARAMRPGITADDYVRKIVAPVRAADGVGDGLDTRDVEQARMAEFRELVWETDAEIARGETGGNAALERWSRNDPKLEALLELDPDKDGRLTAGEIEALAQRAFRHVDANNDQALSREELVKADRKKRDAA